MNETELLQKIKDAEQQLADARRMLEDYRSKVPWKPKDGETYYYIGSDGDTLGEVWADYNTDEGRYAIGNVFRTEGDAEREVRRRKTHQKLKELAAKWNTEPINSDDTDQCKWFVYFRERGKVISMESVTVMTIPNQVYFTENCLDKIMREIPEKELIEYCKGD